MSGLYRYGGLTLRCTASLPELATVEPGALGETATSVVADISVIVDHEPWGETRGDVPSEPVRQAEPAHGDMEMVQLEVASTSDGYTLRFPSVAEFELSTSATRLRIRRAPNTDLRTLRHLLLDQVLPRVLAYRGSFVVHGASVAVHEQALCFVGDSGRGKSTLAASFHGAGFPLISDDGVVLTHAIQAVEAVPVYPSLRLWPASIAGVYHDAPPAVAMARHSTKKRVLLDASSAVSPLPLRAAILLAPPSDTGVRDIRTQRLDPRAACMTLVANSFQLDVQDTARAAVNLATAARICARVPVLSVVYPRDYSRLHEVRAAILRAVGEAVV